MTSGAATPKPGWQFLAGVTVLLNGLTDPEEIRWQQRAQERKQKSFS